MLSGAQGEEAGRKQDQSEVIGIPRLAIIDLELERKLERIGIKGRAGVLQGPAGQFVRGCEKLAEAVKGMRSAKNYERVMRDCIAIHEVENAGDDILHDALGELFKTEKDAIKVIKWKDIYETMEAVTDRLEDVANVMQGVIVKMS